ncbi:unnamed protein product [Clonostachys rhizophaga]|uniref:Uncharacterized protein n=1 Tax=Clonostachys rhizophaga TaxID=160324 RepID=A0A9N9VZZ2_9HYPO|nr:unnamed protein product [Clonostachys rhizophaga]
MVAEAYESSFQPYAYSDIEFNRTCHLSFIEELHGIMGKIAAIRLVVIAPGYLRGHGGEVIQCGRTFGRVVFDIGPELTDRTAVWVFAWMNFGLETDLPTVE